MIRILVAILVTTACLTLLAVGCSKKIPAHKLYEDKDLVDTGEGDEVPMEPSPPAGTGAAPAPAPPGTGQAPAPVAAGTDLASVKGAFGKKMDTLSKFLHEKNLEASKKEVANMAAEFRKVIDHQKFEAHEKIAPPIRLILQAITKIVEKVNAGDLEKAETEMRGLGSHWNHIGRYIMMNGQLPPPGTYEDNEGLGPRPGPGPGPVAPPRPGDEDDDDDDFDRPLGE
jgi:hypothetical protein